MFNIYHEENVHWKAFFFLSRISTLMANNNQVEFDVKELLVMETDF